MALRGTCAAQGASILVRTYLLANAAARAFFGKEGELGMRALSLGVMAPEAIEIAALEEDGGAQPLAVGGGGTLDIENERLSFHVRWRSFQQARHR